MKSSSPIVTSGWKTECESGQGLVEYALALTLVALLVVASISLVRPAAAEALADMSQGAPAPPPSLLGGVTPVPVTAPLLLATDDFESGSGDGGKGWLGGWRTDAYAKVSGEDAHGDAFHLEVWKQGYGERQLGPTGSRQHTLRFWWKAVGLENNDRFELQVFDGDWHPVWSVGRYDVDTKYKVAEIDLSHFTIGEGFKVRFQGHSNGGDDRLLIDDVEIVGR